MDREPSEVNRWWLKIRGVLQERLTAQLAQSVVNATPKQKFVGLTPRSGASMTYMVVFVIRADSSVSFYNIFLLVPRKL